MKPHRHIHAMIALAAGLFAVFTSSCYYDSYYYGGGPTGSVAASYSSGFGYGYGYGGRNFSTSVFVSTGDPRWGYDPYCQSYYDYNRRCYYDPFLHGYYPLGYRPPVLVGVPHPVGWRTGYCPPPRIIRDVRVANYHDRAGCYRSSRYDWAQQVRNRNPRTVDSRPPNRVHTTGREESRPSQTRPPGGGFYGNGRTESRIPNRNPKVPQNYYRNPVSTRNDVNLRSERGGGKPNDTRQGMIRSSAEPGNSKRNGGGGNGGKPSRSEESRKSKNHR